jgi:non-specific serine/threonine protein kinase
LYGGEPHKAIEPLEHSLAAHRTLGHQAAAVYDQVLLAMSAALLGNDQRAVALLEDSVAASQASGEHWLGALALWALGIAACRQGDYERATVTQRHSIELRMPLDDRMNISLNMQVLAWAAAGSGDSTRAARLFGAAEANAEATGFRPIALAHLSELHERFKMIARRDLGQMAFTKGFQLGAKLEFGDAVEFALADKESTRPPPATHGGTEVGLLTPREREVADLIMRGLSNRDIAGRLMISPRTAEGHVEHILAKLSFTARSQIAAWAAQQGTGPSHG